MISVKEIAYEKKPLILVIDDNSRDLQIIGTILNEEGYNTSLNSKGIHAIESLEEISPDLILLDITMPDLDGFQVCERIKKKDKFKNIPIIFFTARSDTESIVKAFQVGGVDYITKPFRKEELLARVKTHVDLKLSREKIEQKSKEINIINKQLQKSNEEKERYFRLINSELDIAAGYVRSLLPPPILEGSILSKWKYVPSTMLGGDSFGYHWLDKNHFAFYLLDVCNHGIGPALMSISILNMIRFQNLHNVDFLDPAQVLSALNKTFQMEDHNDMYFSAWYGVYNKEKSILSYGGAGHPAPIIVSERSCTKLKSNNIIIGVLPEFNFNAEKVKIEKPSSIFLFSDGVYEFRKPMTDIWSLEKLYDYFSNTPGVLFGIDSTEIENLYDHLKKLNKNQKLKDDFSVLKITII